MTVALVNVPLSISLGVAGGANPLMGILTALWAGLIAAMFGGSQFNIVGPTGALSGVLALYVGHYGIGVLPILAVGSGLLCLLFYALRWDKYIVFIPSSVTHGFTLGVAFVIALNQLNFALGLTGLTPHEKLISNVLESFGHIGAANPVAVILFLSALALLFLCLRFVPRLPGPILVAVLGIGLGYAANRGFIDLPIQTLVSKFGQFETRLFQLPSLTSVPLSAELLKGIATVALVAVLETLLSAKIADGMTKTRFDQPREVLGLGLANIASGLLGGMPATAALARTALNIKSGAASRASALINAVSVALITLVFFRSFQYLPLPVVAAILVYVAVRMVETDRFLHLFKKDQTMFWVSLFVAVLTVTLDPIIGILTGAFISLLLFAKQLSKGQSEISLHKNQHMVARIAPHQLNEHEDRGDMAVIRLAGEMTYINGQAHLETAQRVRAPHTVILNFRNLFYIDLDGLDVLHEIVNDLKSRGKRVAMSSMSDAVAPLFETASWYREMEKEGLVFESTSVALREMENNN